jgi:hypothetical protein
MPEPSIQPRSNAEREGLSGERKLAQPADLYLEEGMLNVEDSRL